jgi:hypothetical protein
MRCCSGNYVSINDIILVTKNIHSILTFCLITKFFPHSIDEFLPDIVVAMQSERMAQETRWYGDSSSGFLLA